MRDKATGLSKGGMASKLEAARIATTAGENVIIASGRSRATCGASWPARPVGTLFLAQGQTIAVVEALDRLHRPAARHAGARRRRARGASKGKAKACWRSAWSMRQGTFRKGRRRFASRCQPARNSPAA